MSNGLFARLDDVALTVHADGSGHIAVGRLDHEEPPDHLELTAAELQSLAVLMRVLK